MIVNHHRTTVRYSGFTLLEVLIALAVVSVALLTLSYTGGAAPAHYSDLRQHTFALWVADNALAELRLDEGFPPPGTRFGREQMAGINWRWQAEISATSEQTIRRVDVTVYYPETASTDERAVLSHVGFMGQ